MSRSLNKAILIGNLGADPEVRSTSNGSRVATLSVATSRQWKNQSGEKQEKTEWHRVVLWNNKGVDARGHRGEILQEGRQGLHRGQHRVSLVAGPRGADALHHGNHGARAHPALRPERWWRVLVRRAEQGGRGGGRAQGQGVVRGFPRGARRRGRRPAVLSGAGGGADASRWSPRASMARIARGNRCARLALGEGGVHGLTGRAGRCAGLNSPEGTDRCPTRLDGKPGTKRSP